uniref:Uncharacterized protein n=2 Tax=Ditylum brightwellii TaxID=49249 RepID=A0A7S4S555_9STRA
MANSSCLSKAGSRKPLGSVASVDNMEAASSSMDHRHASSSSILDVVSSSGNKRGHFCTADQYRRGLKGSSSNYHRQQQNDENRQPRNESSILRRSMDKRQPFEKKRGLSYNDYNRHSLNSSQKKKNKLLHHHSLQTINGNHNEENETAKHCHHLQQQCSGLSSSSCSSLISEQAADDIYHPTSRHHRRRSEDIVNASNKHILSSSHDRKAFVKSNSIISKHLEAEADHDHHDDNDDDDELTQIFEAQRQTSLLYETNEKRRSSNIQHDSIQRNQRSSSLSGRENPAVPPDHYPCQEYHRHHESASSSLLSPIRNYEDVTEFHDILSDERLLRLLKPVSNRCLPPTMTADTTEMAFTSLFHAHGGSGERVIHRNGASSAFVTCQNS